MSPPYLPQELKDEIFDLAADHIFEQKEAIEGRPVYPKSRITYLPLMLASRASLLRCRRYAHRQFKAGPTTKYPFCDEQDERWFNDEELHKYFQVIHITGMTSNQKYTVDEFEVDHQWMCKVVSLIQKFSSVHTIKMDHICWGQIRTETRQSLMAFFSRISHLSLEEFRFRNSNQMAQALGSCSRLTTLSLNDASWILPIHLPQQLQSSQQTLKLDFLRVNLRQVAGYKFLAAWLLGRKDLTVRNLELVWPDRTIDSALDLIRHVAPSLETLSLEALVQDSLGEFQFSGSDIAKYSLEDDILDDDEQRRIPLDYANHTVQPLSRKKSLPLPMPNVRSFHLSITFPAPDAIRHLINLLFTTLNSRTTQVHLAIRISPDQIVSSTSGLYSRLDYDLTTGVEFVGTSQAAGKLILLTVQVTNKHRSVPTLEHVLPRFVTAVALRQLKLKINYINEWEK